MSPKYSSKTEGVQPQPMYSIAHPVVFQLKMSIPLRSPIVKLKYP